jgi:hypothetical protein
VSARDLALCRGGQRPKAAEDRQQGDEEFHQSEIFKIRVFHGGNFGRENVWQRRGLRIGNMVWTRRVYCNAGLFLIKRFHMAMATNRTGRQEGNRRTDSNYPAPNDNDARERRKGDENDARQDQDDKKKPSPFKDPWVRIGLVVAVVLWRAA